MSDAEKRQKYQEAMENIQRSLDELNFSQRRLRDSIEELAFKQTRNYEQFTALREELWRKHKV